jgi:hypothetical protein
MSDQIVAPRTRDLAELGSQLSRWLAGKLPQASYLSIANLDYPRGAGRSHETILFDLTWTEGGRERTQGLVIRVKPLANQIYPDDLFEEQYRVMQAMHQRGIVPVAQTLWFEEDPAIVGAPFFVMHKLEGRVAVSYPGYAKHGWVAEATPDQRHRFWGERRAHPRRDPADAAARGALPRRARRAHRTGAGMGQVRPLRRMDQHRPPMAGPRPGAGSAARTLAPKPSARRGLGRCAARQHDVR